MTTGTTIKIASLLALVLQQTCLVLVIRYSRIHPSVDDDGHAIPYLTTVAVLVAECLKFVLNLTLEFLTRGTTTQVSDEKNAHAWRGCCRTFLGAEGIRLLMPAFFYLIQNNLIFVALTNLSVPVYQVANQGKLLTTALCSRLLLQRTISATQYCSLVVLAIGVAVVQISAVGNHVDSTGEGKQIFLGIGAVTTSCFTSALAGVYFEKLVKNKSNTSSLNPSGEVSVYIRNSQLAFWSICLGIFSPILAGDDFKKMLKEGIFQGFNSVVWTTVVFQATTGLLVGFVMKYADAILKGFATSVAVVLATVLSVHIFDVKLDNLFALGALMVVLAVKTYTNDSFFPVPPKDGFRFLYFLLPVLVLLWTLRLADLESTFLVNAKDTSQKCRLGDISNSEIPEEFRHETFPQSPCGGDHAFYMRSDSEWLEKQNGTCATSLTVLSWVMDKAICQKEAILIAYGELIHLLRDKSLSRDNGTYFDDDFDTWTTQSAFQMVVNLEPLLWENFGWSIRVFRTGCNNSTRFGQVVAACGHTYSRIASKADGYFPSIEMYPILDKFLDDLPVVFDAWMETKFEPSWMFPPAHVAVETIEGNRRIAMDVQIPADAEKILDCVYGNWTGYSTKHADPLTECTKRTLASSL